MPVFSWISFTFLLPTILGNKNILGTPWKKWRKALVKFTYHYPASTLEKKWEKTSGVYSRPILESKLIMVTQKAPPECLLTTKIRPLVWKRQATFYLIISENKKLYRFWQTQPDMFSCLFESCLIYKWHLKVLFIAFGILPRVITSFFPSKMSFS